MVAALIYKRPGLPFILGGLAVLALLLSFLPPIYYARLSTLVDIAGGNESTIIAGFRCAAGPERPKRL